MSRCGRTTAALLAAALLPAGCSGHSTNDLPGTATASQTFVAPFAALHCAEDIGGDAPPADFTVVQGAVALPTAPRHAALQAEPGGGPPKLFAKTGLVIRAGATAELTIPSSVGANVGIGWANGPAGPNRSFLVPGCADLRGTGWLAYPGGYWADEPLCLPVDVRVGDQVQRVQIGVGKACPGQAPPPTP